jgi:hypothetical protein
VQQRRLHKENQPIEQLDRVIEEIRELMLRSAQEAVNKGKLNRGEPAITTGKKKKKKKNNNNNKGARGQLQGEVWDPGGFQQQNIWRAHEKELMIFPAVEYDAGASLHLSNAPTFQHINAHSREGEAPTLPFLNSKYDPIGINVVRLSEDQAMPLYRQKIRSPLMADRLMALDSIQTRWPFMKLQCNR